MRGHERIGLVGGVALLAAAGVIATVVLATAGPDRYLPGGGGVGGASPSASPPYVPNPTESLFPTVTRTGAMLGGENSDLFLPRPPDTSRSSAPFPIAVLLTDPGIDPRQYEQFAHDVASQGVAVVVTDHPVPAAYDEVGRWAREVADDPDAYVHGKVERDVAFVLAHGDAATGDAVPSSVRAVVEVTPTSAVERRARDTSGVAVPISLVCGDRAATARACAASRRTIPRTVVVGADVMSVTDEGSRGPRASTAIPAKRLRTISDLARPAALWLLAHKGDSPTRPAVAEQGG